MNDPNGCFFAGGRYHVFFQHNPDAPVHAAIKWGHMSSADLVTWQPEPVALVNRPGEPDAYGCWTGCVVDDDGVPTAVYSAVNGNRPLAGVLLARGDRSMRTWQQTSSLVVGPPRDPTVSQVRDPYVFEAFGHRYAIQGAGRGDGQPCVLVYDCDDLTAWRELGVLLDGDDPVAGVIAPADVWECPNLVRLGDRWVLVVSLWRREGLMGVRYLVGDLTLPGPCFRPQTGGLLDRGPCFYAPQLLPLPDRTLMWAWAWERDRPDTADWAGCLTYARELSLVGDVLVSRPAADLPAIDLEPGPGALWLDDTLVAEFEVPASPLVPPRLFLDGSMVEIFDGTATPFTTRAYPTHSSRWHVRGQDDARRDRAVAPADG
ncbi:glycoside hydrolase family 32 protein [Actinoplanes sp. LDG1-06]|uniref:beta-fructofuranosidase n=1 Tax=Paractinoplanes ovalisporus TaxID=2810368 RepID=A0ABS2AQK8_9ACTN|nr:glycoside hydrolase family 32 protein [Actinoplanes ovalisporus]